MSEPITMTNTAAAGRADTRLKNCPHCRNAVSRSAETCTHCGYVFHNRAAFRPPQGAGEPATPVPAAVHQIAPARHDVTLATLASVTISGGGQFYNGQRAKGVLLFLLPILLFALLRLNALYVAPLVWLVSIIDAALVAGRLARGEAVGPGRWF